MEHQVDVLLTGRHTALCPIGPRELPTAVDLVRACQPFAWRGLGPGVPHATVARMFDENVLAQFLVLSARDQRPVGVVQAISPLFIGGTVHLTFAVKPEYQRSGWPLESLGLFINYLFVAYPLRLVLVELPSNNSASLANGLGRLMSLDGCRPASEWHGGEYRDVYQYSLSREDFYSLPLTQGVIGGTSND